MCGNHILEPPEQLPRSFTLDMLRRFDFTLPNTQNLSPLHSRVLEYPAITAHPGHPPWKCWVICFFGDGPTRPRVELLDIYGLEINGKAPNTPYQLNNVCTDEAEEAPKEGKKRTRSVAAKAAPTT